MHDCTGSDSSCMSIYSLGDAGFMKDILNGVAMIHGSGSFYQAAASALLFGFLIMIFKSLLNGALRISFGEISDLRSCWSRASVRCMRSTGLPGSRFWNPCM